MSDALTIGVIGGGVAGLAAARALARAGAAVTVFEASDRLGGQVHTVTVAGHPVDVGAEALHLAGPDTARTVSDLGLDDETVTARPGHSWIWTARGLRRLPAGVGPAGPTRLGPVLRARVLSPAGLARAAAEPLVPRHRAGADVSVGALVSHRFGRQVTDRLVDPLLGNLHAGDVARLSLRATTPALAATTDRHRSVVLANRRRGPGGGPPPFVTFRSGLGRLTGALRRGAGVRVRRSTPVLAVEPDGSGYRLVGRHGVLARCDGVVVAAPAAVAARLLAPLAPAACLPLHEVRSASVATVVVAYPRRAADAAPALSATGLLAPSTAPSLLKAATFLSRKWPHLDDPDLFLVRLSAGRAGEGRIAELADHELVRVLHGDLAQATGLHAEPVAVHVQRWTDALPQLEVGHQTRLAAARHALGGHPRVALAGAAYDGLGVAACLRAGHEAAAAVVAAAADRGCGP